MNKALVPTAGVETSAPAIGASGADWVSIAEMVAIDDGLGTVFVEFTGPRPPAGTKLYVKGNAGVPGTSKNQQEN